MLQRPVAGSRPAGIAQRGLGPRRACMPSPARSGGGGAAAAPRTAAAAAGGGGSSSAPSPARRPILVFDIMDTIVSDPFFEHMPRFFSLSFKELLAQKHPTAWVEFEKGEIDERALFDKFFADGRGFDGPALVQHMITHYTYVDGMPQLLSRLRDAGYDAHAMSNYPVWWRNIEDKLAVSRYLEWSFISCEGPMEGHRKPSPAAYESVTAALAAHPSDLLFVDDRAVNVEAAAKLGWGAVHFKSAEQLEAELRARGLEF